MNLGFPSERAHHAVFSALQSGREREREREPPGIDSETLWSLSPQDRMGIMGIMGRLLSSRVTHDPSSPPNYVGWDR